MIRLVRIVPAVATTLLLAVAGVASSQPAPTPASGPRVYVRDVGPGFTGRLLREALARPHVTVDPPDSGIVFGRGTDVRSSLVVLRGPARLEGRVRGDFIVLGDIVLRPGAIIEGRAIAIGGEILNSSLAVVSGERFVFRDVAFVPTREAPGVVALSYRSLDLHPIPVVSLPGVFGLRLPSYDRVNGAVIPFGPEIALDTGKIRIDPLVTYRSSLGVVDPGVQALWQPSRRLTIEASAQRATLTNESWVRGDFVNGVASFFAGSDVRNYYRADRAEVTVARQWETTSGFITPFVGGLVERAWSVRYDSLRQSAPFSFYARKDRVEGMLRPNPGVTGGRIVSAVAGVHLRVLTGPVTTSVTVRAEVPATVTVGERFTQITGDGDVGFPTFRDQRFEAAGHFVGSTGGPVPSQRFAYLGGGNTIPTLDLLSQGGDELLWLESRYIVPVTAIHVPLAGSPTVTVRHLVGGAGIGQLPDLTQNVGLRLGLAMLRLDFVIDPAHTDRHEFGASIGFR